MGAKPRHLQSRLDWLLAVAISRGYLQSEIPEIPEILEIPK